MHFYTTVTIYGIHFSNTNIILSFPITGAFKSSQSITLSPSSPQKKSSAPSSPSPGVPTAPGNLRMQEHGPTSVILQWEASVICGKKGEITDFVVDGKLF